jgi:hypothetical protein
VPGAPFPPVDDSGPLELPLEIAGTGGTLHLDAVGETTVRVTVTPDRSEDRFSFEHPQPVEVPRYWLARMLFRAGLHGLQLNNVETYGGFFLDDSGPDLQLGIHVSHGRFAVALPRAEALATIERIYRAVAPAGYTERLA